MEIPGGRQSKVYVLIYEALGTGLLITAANWSSDTGFGTFIIGL